MFSYDQKLWYIYKSIYFCLQSFCMITIFVYEFDRKTVMQSGFWYPSKGFLWLCCFIRIDCTTYHPPTSRSIAKASWGQRIWNETHHNCYNTEQTKLESLLHNIYDHQTEKMNLVKYFNLKILSIEILSIECQMINKSYNRMVFNPFVIENFDEKSHSIICSVTLFAISNISLQKYQQILKKCFLIAFLCWYFMVIIF